MKAARINEGKQYVLKIAVKDKIAIVTPLLAGFFPAEEIGTVIRKCLAAAEIAEKKHVSVLELARLEKEIEAVIAVSFGSMAAREAMNAISLFSEKEKKELIFSYAKTLAELKVFPEELKDKIDYYKEREEILLAYSKELEGAVRGLREQIEERKKTQLALAESELKFRDFAEKSALGVYLIQDNVFIYVNPAFFKIFKYPVEDIIGAKTMADLLHPDDLDMYKAKVHGALLGEIPYLRYEAKGLTKNKEIIYLDIYSSHTIYQGKPAIIGTVIDITERKLMEREIIDARENLEQKINERTDDLANLIVKLQEEVKERRVSEEKIKLAAEEWRTTFDSITDMISLHDKDYKILRVNKAFADAVGMKPQEIIGKNCFELCHGLKEAHLQCPISGVFSGSGLQRAEFFDPHLGIFLEVSIAPIVNSKGEIIAAIHIAKDVTQKKDLERVQRLSQLGKLVAEMAHEVNNPLMVISGRAQLSLLQEIKDEEIKNNLKTIFEQSQRAKDIIQRLLKFSRPSKQERKMVDIEKTIEDVVQIVEHQYSVLNIRIKRNYGKNLSPVLADEKQLQEVFMNLLNNARDAMPKSGGEIEVVLSREAEFIRADIKDTGSGMTEETRQKIFDPFFTTKEKGTGLGLAICFNIIKSFGGELKCESRLGQGTTMSIVLSVAHNL